MDYINLDECSTSQENFVDLCDENLEHLRNYTSEVSEFLLSHDTVSVPNALEINRYMQRMLAHLKNKIENILAKCREKYAANDKLLTSGDFRGRTKNKNCLKNYPYCGAPFFKDENRFCAPPNEDYIYRRNVLKEFFPLDMKERSIALWTLKDKLGIIQGIKSQVVDYLDDEKTKERIINRPERTKELEKNIAIHTKRLVDFLAQVDEKFEINWYRISVESLGGRHPENCCEAMWHMYLRPELNRGEWTNEDNKKLFRVAQNNRFQDWDKIAQEMGDRSSYQCIVHFQTYLTPSLRDKNKRWTPEQDMLLKEAVEANRSGDVIQWNKVLSHFPHKSKNQIYVRYKYALDPHLKKRAFTKEEDCIILAAVQEYGENFKHIPKSLFPRRTKVQVKGRYFNVLKPSIKQQSWTPEDDRKLLELVEEHGTSNWVTISQELRTHTRTSCRTRYCVIKRYLDKNPHKTIEDIPRKKKRVLADINMDNWVEKIIEIKQNEGNEEKENPNGSRRRETGSYRERRRSIERNYYEFFKYSFDFKYGEAKSSRFSGVKSLLYLKHLLFFTVSPEDYKISRNRFTKKEKEVLKESLKDTYTASIVKQNIPFDFKLPPSWCTILGLRAVCIQITSETLFEPTGKRIKSIDKREEGEPDEVLVAKELFKKRFFTVFYKTALLEKLSPSVREVLNGNNYTIAPITKKRKLNN